jgi:PAS domain S-box-containing protein
MDFLQECGEAVVLLSRSVSPFEDLLLNPAMNSGMVLPVKAGQRLIGALFLNSRYQNHYGNERFRYLDSLVRLAGGLLENARLLKEIRVHLARIEALERYQESIFQSMTNYLITTDGTDRIRYFNQAAAEAFDLGDDAVDSKFSERFKKGLGPKVLKVIAAAGTGGEVYAGLEGIYRQSDGEEMDFSLNVTPFKTASGRREGVTLLFTDQTRERILQAKADTALDQSRKIKDMFSRYLSHDLVKSLTDNPDMVKLGGDKKTATVFFADITGYTAFSEGRDPEHVIEVVNGFFNEAVELVINNHGFIDKFIGDCIMAAWGVPAKTEEDDAVLAVTTALQIHELVRSRDRKFFLGDASRLKISIGMSSGPLVAGNVGSARRMEYTVLGDTVNTAARLEGVAKAEEIIISQATRELLGDRFKLEERPPVAVKGKEKPLVIFNVRGINR